jgi:hypothetical protein
MCVKKYYMLDDCSLYRHLVMTHSFLNTIFMKVIVPIAMEMRERKNKCWAVGDLNEAIVTYLGIQSQNSPEETQKD